MIGVGEITHYLGDAVGSGVRAGTQEIAGGRPKSW